MSGYSKVTVNKVKKTLKATGVSMRMIPVSLRKLASFMTHFLFCWASLFGPDQSQRAHLPSSRAPETALSAQRPPILCRHSAPSTRSPSSGRSMSLPAPRATLLFRSPTLARRRSAALPRWCGDEADLRERSTTCSSTRTVKERHHEGHRPRHVWLARCPRTQGHRQARDRG